MTRKLQWFSVTALLLAVLVGLAPTDVSGGGKGKDKKPAMSPVETLALAAKMEDVGKATKSPSALLAAAELYWSIVPDSVKPLKNVDVKIEDAEDGVKGDPAPKELPKLEDPRATAKKLFDLALDYAKPNEESGVKELIKGIKGTLGSLQGPHHLTFAIAGKQKQTVPIPFVGNAHAHIGFRSNTGAPLHVHINGPNVNLQETCVSGTVNWIPTKNGVVHIHVHNTHQQFASYTIWVN